MSLDPESLSVWARPWRLSPQGVLVYGEPVQVLSNVSALSTASSIAGDGQINDAEGSAWLGAHLLCEVDSPSGTAGPVTFFLERAVNGQWDSEGQGIPLAVVHLAGAGVRRRSAEI